MTTSDGANTVEGVEVSGVLVTYDRFVEVRTRRRRMAAEFARQPLEATTRRETPPDEPLTIAGKPVTEEQGLAGR